MTMRAHVRSCDPSLHDDPPQEVRALLQNPLRNALPLLVPIHHLAVALSQLCACPRDESVTFQQLRPVAHFSRPERCKHLAAPTRSSLGGMHRYSSARPLPEHRHQPPRLLHHPRRVLQIPNPGLLYCAQVRGHDSRHADRHPGL